MNQLPCLTRLALALPDPPPYAGNEGEQQPLQPRVEVEHESRVRSLDLCALLQSSSVTINGQLTHLHSDVPFECAPHSFWSNNSAHNNNSNWHHLVHLSLALVTSSVEQFLHRSGLHQLAPQLARLELLCRTLSYSTQRDALQLYGPRGMMIAHPSFMFIKRCS